MKKIKKLIKFFTFIFLFGLVVLFGFYGYAKLTPKLEIKSANAFLMYDSNEALFYQGSGSQ